MRGKPMRFEDFPYVRQVFHDNARIVVLLWARSMTKTTTIASILTHKLVTNAYSGAMAAAPGDKQAWRVTKEHIRPRFTESMDKMLLPLIFPGHLRYSRKSWTHLLRYSAQVLRRIKVRSLKISGFDSGAASQAAPDIFTNLANTIIANPGLLFLMGCLFVVALFIIMDYPRKKKNG